MNYCLAVTRLRLYRKHPLTAAADDDLSEFKFESVDLILTTVVAVDYVQLIFQNRLK
jgi:hypothetical protein